MHQPINTSLGIQKCQMQSPQVVNATYPQPFALGRWILGMLLICALDLSQAETGLYNEVGIAAGVNSVDFFTDSDGGTARLYATSPLSRHFSIEFAYRNLGEASNQAPTPVKNTDNDNYSLPGVDYGTIETETVQDQNGVPVNDPLDPTLLQNRLRFTGIQALEPEAVSFALVGYLPYKQARFYAKAGALAWWAEQREIIIQQETPGADATFSTQIKGNSASSAEAFWGAGLVVDLWFNLAMRLDAEIIKISDRNVTVPSTNYESYTLGIEYRF